MVSIEYVLLFSGEGGACPKAIFWGVSGTDSSCCGLAWSLLFFCRRWRCLSCLAWSFCLFCCARSCFLCCCCASFCRFRVALCCLRCCLSSSFWAFFRIMSCFLFCCLSIFLLFRSSTSRFLWDFSSALSSFLLRDLVLPGKCLYHLFACGGSKAVLSSQSWANCRKSRRAISLVNSVYFLEPQGLYMGHVGECIQFQAWKIVS